MDAFDRDYTMDGRSWYQGYAPRTNGNAMTVYLPIPGEELTGNLTASLTLDDPDYTFSGTLPGMSLCPSLTEFIR